MITMYGIPNCDKIKKAKVWLEKHNAEYKFYNYINQNKTHLIKPNLNERNVYRLILI